MNLGLLKLVLFTIIIGTAWRQVLLVVSYGFCYETTGISLNYKQVQSMIFPFSLFIFYSLCPIRNSVMFKGSSGDDSLIKGLDISGPPSLPRPFIILSGGEADVIVASDDEDEDVTDELNNAMMENGEREAENNNAGPAEFGDM